VETRTGTAPSMVAMLKDMLLSRWSEFKFAQPRPRDLHSSLKVCGPGDSVVIRLAHPAAGLVAVAKAALMPQAQERIRAEFESLGLVRSRLEKEPILASVPRPLDLVQMGREVVLLEAAVDGIPLRSLLSAGGKDGLDPRGSRYLQLAFQWLVEFHGAMAARGHPLCQHGDYSLVNLLWQGHGRLGVVDWEYCGDRLPPMFDLFSLLSSFARLPGTADNFLMPFFAPGWFSKAAVGMVEEYAVMLGLPKADGEDCLRLYLEEKGRRTAVLYGERHPYTRGYSQALDYWRQHRPLLFSSFPAEGAVSAKGTRPGRLYKPAKRMLDVLLSGGSLLVLSPLLGAVALAIKLDSPGPVLFRQRRVGRNGKEFTCLKFRSMRDGAEEAVHKRNFRRWLKGEEGVAVYKDVGDGRITRLGPFLRATNLDELPQLINVLRGDMSLVGPRPAITYELEMYSPRHFQRLAVKPGLTGLWQVRNQHLCSFEQMVEIDMDYIGRRSLGLDIKLVLLTVPRLLGIRGRGQHD
jgi:lipopolysaccharide/colanic/teichoic acid biosynthesis glycosyltransferase